MNRVTDWQECVEVTRHYPDYFSAYNPEEWFNDDKNYALKEGQNVALAEWKMDGVYFVHFCYHTKRGKDAIDLTNRIFVRFCQDRPVKMVIGLIEEKNKPARYLIRQAGFQSLSMISTVAGPCEMFYRLNKRGM